jgi:superfamily II DNA or RNA helicase
MLKKDVKLEPHQEEALQNLHSNNGRILLAMATGSGKTVTSIAGIESLAQQGKAKNVLVIVPAALKDNFINSGIKKFSDNVSIHDIQGSHKMNAVQSSRDGTLNYHVVSQELFRLNPDKYLMTAKGPIDSLIVDEMARAKNFDSKLADALMNSSNKVRNVIGLAGSVSSNTPSEVVPMLHSILGSNFSIKDPADFKRRFMQNVTVKDEHGHPVQETRLKNMRSLKEIFGKSVFYYGQEELEKDYPKKIEETIKIPLAGREKQLYDFAMGDLSRSDRKRVEQGLPPSSAKEMKHIFTRLLRARQASVSTDVWGNKEPIEKTIEDSPKIKAVIEDIQKTLKETPDAKIMVYSDFINGGLKTLSESLKSKNIKHGLFVGKGNKEFKGNDRNKAVKEYNVGKSKVLLVSSSGKEGIDLPNTTHISLLSNTYNPEAENQAVARGVRLKGQSNRKPEDRKVVVKKYISTLPETFLNRWHLTKRKKSVEEFVDSISSRKAKQNDEFKQFLKQLRTTNHTPIITPAKNSSRKIGISKVKNFLSGRNGITMETKPSDKSNK